MVEAIAAAVAATTSLVSAGIAAGEKDKEFQRSNTCVFDYEKKARTYREKMWATPILTPERVAYEGKANAWQKKADEARIKGCPAKMPDQLPADMLPAPPAADNTLTYLAAGLGLVVVVGAGIYLARSR